MLHDLKPYTRLSPDGDGIDFDLDAIAVDLVTVAKAAKVSREVFFFNMERIWREVEVTVTHTPRAPTSEEIH